MATMFDKKREKDYDDKSNTPINYPDIRPKGPIGVKGKVKLVIHQRPSLNR